MYNGIQTVDEWGQLHPASSRELTEAEGRGQEQSRRPVMTELGKGKKKGKGKLMELGPCAAREEAAGRLGSQPPPAPLTSESPTPNSLYSPSLSVTAVRIELRSKLLPQEYSPLLSGSCFSGPFSLAHLGLRAKTCHATELGL